MRLSQSLAEETSGGSCIPLGREQKVDRLPDCIDGTVKIHPLALHPNVCLVHAPGSICHLEMRTDALVQLGCISLDPTKEGRMIHRDATIGEHALEIAIADGKLQIPADRSQNDLRRELSTLERVLACLLHRQPLFTPSLHSGGRRSLKAATEPSGRSSSSSAARLANTFILARPITSPRFFRSPRIWFSRSRLSLTSRARWRGGP